MLPIPRSDETREAFFERAKAELDDGWTELDRNDYCTSVWNSRLTTTVMALAYSLNMNRRRKFD